MSIDSSDERENTCDSIRVNREFDSNDRRLIASHPAKSFADNVVIE
jgi:hypothetical protein